MAIPVDANRNPVSEKCDSFFRLGNKNPEGTPDDEITCKFNLAELGLDCYNAKDSSFSENYPKPTESVNPLFKKS